jgi:hypothetical protein
MSLLDAPAYDPASDRRKRNLLIGSLITIFVLAVLTFTGYATGHGWLFTNLPAEHRVNNFFNALEAKDYNKAFAIYNNDSDWQQHPAKYKDYPLARFTEDWTTESPIKAPITSHHVDISRTDGTGMFGTGIIVAVRVNLQDGIVPVAAGESPNTQPGHKVFMYVIKSDGTLTFPAPHVLQYD